MDQQHLSVESFWGTKPECCEDADMRRDLTYLLVLHFKKETFRLKRIPTNSTNIERLAFR